MRLLIVRHAIAEDKIRFAKTGKPDDERPLTRDGARKMERNARGLRALEPEVGLIATSPLARARETAEILERGWRAPIETWDSLAPAEAPQSALGPIAGAASKGTVVLVGHEPHLSELACWLLTGDERSFLVMKKGGACLIEFPTHVAERQAVLRWAMAPSQLRAQGRA